MSRRGGVCSAAVLVLGCASHHGRPPPPAACATSSQPGIASQHATWRGDGWAALIPDGSRVLLREFTASGEARGDAAEVAETPCSRSDIAWSGRDVRVACAEVDSVRVLQVAATNEAHEARVRVNATGDLALVPRPDVSARPAALFVEDDHGAVMALVDDDGDVGALHRCGAAVPARAVVAVDDGFAAVVTGASGVEVVWLDDACVVRRSTRLTDDPAGERAGALAADAQGVVAAWASASGGAWVAGVDREGRVRIRPRRLDDHARSPRVLLRADEHGHRTQVRVLVVHAHESGDQVRVHRLLDDGTPQDVGGVAEAQSITLRFVAPDPWGGAWLGWTGTPPRAAGGASGATTFHYATRLCP